MLRITTRRVIRPFFKTLLLCLIAMVLVVIFLPEGRFSVFLRRHFEKTWPGGWRTVHEEQGGSITVFFAPCKPSDTDGIDDQLVNFIDSAKDEIKAAVYDFELDNVADAFLNANNRGVRLFVVFYGGHESRQIKKLLRAGIKTGYRPKGQGLMHNKFVVVDGKRVWTGSMNFTPNGAYKNNNNGVIINSEKIAANYIAEFEEMYDGFFGSASPENTPYPTVYIDGIEVENYFGPEDGVEQEILSELRTAKQEIVFMAFAFTSVPIAELMAARIDEGIEVRGVFEKRGRSRYTRYDFLKKAGAQVQWDSNRYSMHHKVIVIDREVVVIGSYNFSKSANTRNDENCLIIHSSQLAQAFLKEFQRLCQ